MGDAKNEGEAVKDKQWKRLPQWQEQQHQYHRCCEISG